MNRQVRMLLLMRACSLGNCLIGQLAAQETPPLSLWSPPPLERSLSIRDGLTGEPITFDRLLVDLTAAEVVFLGESHSDETTHRVELAIYQALLKRKNSHVVLALEMFERDVQNQLDNYLAGEIDESTFLQQVRPWATYREAYRPLIELAKATGTPVIAANFPTSIRRRIAMEGSEVIDQLSAEERRWIPKKFYSNTRAYWRRVDNVTRSHRAMMPTDLTEQERLYSTQSLWDNSMGAACAEAIEQHPHCTVLHINGDFHSAYWGGAVHQLKLRKPEVRIKTVSMVADLNPQTATDRGKPVADYLIHVESRATHRYEGERTVQIGQSLRYRFHLPEEADDQRPAPLLIWLADDGLTAKEGLEFWQQQLGQSVAIAAVEAPYLESQQDLAQGGRWYWPQTFSEDTARVGDGIDRIWAYLLRHFPLQPRQICLAGEGTGATMAVAMALQTERVAMKSIAWNPRQYSKIVDLPLLLPEYQGEQGYPQRSLKVIGNLADQSHWDRELAEYRATGLESEYLTDPSEPWLSERQASNSIRAALGLPDLAETEQEKKFYLVVKSVSSRATHWARLQAGRLSAQQDGQVLIVRELPEDADAITISTKIQPRLASNPGVLPKCPGPFGGTTVVVLPDHLPAAERQQWLDLEDHDPLSTVSRFHRVRIATGEGERALTNVLQKLHLENRNNVLIVPAVFYANRSWLHELAEQTVSLQNSMVIQWLPGLGGRPGVLEISHF
ncbi:MAG: ChaN family lipoprotein [Pirellulales bacterium]